MGMVFYGGIKNKNLKAILILGAGDVYDIAKKYFQNKKRT